MNNTARISFTSWLLSMAICLHAADRFVSYVPVSGGFTLAADGAMAAIFLPPCGDEGVMMAIESVNADIREVTGARILNDNVVLAGTVGQPEMVAALRHAGIDPASLLGRREMYILTVHDGRLLIVGSDKRGAIYGLYELSRQMGVSPWTWWMDTPVEHHPDVYIRPGIYTDGEPAVEYRGIFINDEWPCFGEWSNELFGGQNCRLYGRIFELLLRLKGNFMWPAMWNNAFWDDDPENGPLATKMGIVMSTSHHEPMNLAQQDWKRRGGTEKRWNYVTNAEGLREFWRTGIRRSKGWETFVTVGMRGDGDMEMPSAADNRALLERIVHDQREIIEQETGQPAELTPQVWALYKEVQDYYDQGMRVPDDITLLFCDDNWGNVRRIPTPEMLDRKGGFGMYYHFDYVGDPRNSKWINISPISRVWEQMTLCYEAGIRKIWVVNVGDLKPMEYPIQFWMDMAWNPERYNADNLIQHTDSFCTSIFGEQYGREASYLLRTYPRYNRRITLENLNKDTYTFDYDEWTRVVGEYNLLRQRARALENALPEHLQSAYFQLLGMPVEACANLYNMYYAQAMNHRLAAIGQPTRAERKQANQWARMVRQCYDRDSLLTLRWDKMEGGKWRHLMDEKRVGYTYWQTPDYRVVPETVRLRGCMPRRVPWNMVEGILPTQDNDASPRNIACFVAQDGYVSIEAEHYQRLTEGREAHWTVIPELGRTLSGLTTQPIMAPVDGMSVEYDWRIPSTHEPCDSATVHIRLSATLNYIPEGHEIALCMDDGEEQIININGHYRGELGQWQLDHVIDISARMPLSHRDMHTLRIRPLRGGIVMQKTVIDLGGLRRSHLWPLESPADTLSPSYTWSCSPTYVEPKDMPQTGLGGNSVRQIIHLSHGGETLALCLSNRHGDNPLSIRSVFVAPVDSCISAIDASRARYLTYGGQRDIVLDAHATVQSDPIRIHCEQGGLLSVTICYGDDIPEQVTGHPGSRTTSYVLPGQATPAADFSTAERVVCWYTITDAVIPTAGTLSIPVIGNSITDGRGSTTDHQNRLTDAANRILLPDGLALLNFGIGGNCLCSRCLGPSGHDRISYDAFSHLTAGNPLILFIGVNDIGNSTDSDATYRALTDEFHRIVREAHNRGLKVYACTILPFRGHYYYTPEHEVLRRRVNDFIRGEMGADAVIDTDRYMADPADDEQMNPAWHDGDWLHPNANGHRLLGEFMAHEILKISYQSSL